MKPQEWRQKLGDCVRDLFLSPEMEHFYSIPMTLERARIYLLQLGLYVRQRRNFWPQVAANCNEFDVKQRIMEHEHEELVEDEHSKAGHLDLIFRQGKELGLSVDDVLNAQPLPTTKAAIYGVVLAGAQPSLAGGDRGVDHRGVDQRRPLARRYRRRQLHAPLQDLEARSEFQ